MIKQNGQAFMLGRSIHWSKPMRNLFRVKASGDVEVPGLLILALLTSLAVLIGLAVMLLR